MYVCVYLPFTYKTKHLLVTFSAAIDVCVIASVSREVPCFRFVIVFVD